MGALLSFLLVLVAIAAFLVTISGIIDVLLTPGARWKAIGSSKALWVIIQLLIGLIGTILYFVIIRPKLEEVFAAQLAEPLPSFSDAERATIFAKVASEPGVAKPDPILVADNVTRTFGGLTAVDVAHLEVQRGSITALIGPNGAGKTTFFNLITGFDKADTGTWSFDGTSVEGMASHKYPSVGMVRTFQLTKALSRLTVIENMKLGAPEQSGENLRTALIPPVWRAEETAAEQRADELLARFKMDHMRDQFAGTLSGGQRKLLEMARALMAEPKVIMLDEPMAGVNPALTQSLLGHIKDLREDGVTVVFVEHDMDVVRDISDWVVVMAQGQIIAESPPEDIGANKAVIDAYLGAHHDAPLTIEDEERLLAETEAAIQQELAEEERS
jgi:branched-chain amino acid transport system ATP-binding protein